MAKRRTKKQIEFDKIIYNQNQIFGNEVVKEAYPITRFKDGRLRGEMNFSHPTDTSIMFFHMYYGAFITPNTNPDPFGNPKNALRITIDANVKENTNIIIGEINKYLLEDFKKKK